MVDTLKETKSQVVAALDAVEGLIKQASASSETRHTIAEATSSIANSMASALRPWWMRSTPKKRATPPAVPTEEEDDASIRIQHSSQPTQPQVSPRSANVANLKTALNAIEQCDKGLEKQVVEITSAVHEVVSTLDFDFDLPEDVTLPALGKDIEVLNELKRLRDELKEQVGSIFLEET